MQPLSISEIFPHILLTDFLRYFLAAGAAYLVFWVIFFKKWRHRVIQKKPLRFDKIWFEFRYSMSTVLIFALVGMPATRAFTTTSASGACCGSQAVSSL
jgi:uncharacterized membrane protein